MHFSSGSNGEQVAIV